MLEPLRRRLETVDPGTRRHVLREVLQSQVLAAIQQSGGFVPLAFHGGTALRFLYEISRWSEDLDFTLERPDRFDWEALTRGVLRSLKPFVPEVRAKAKDQSVVHKAMLKFPGLLHALGLSGHRDEALSIKLEVDTRPPDGAGLATSILRRHGQILHLQHHDQPSLLAGKLHALLQRSYTKGRDVYDLLWYLSDPKWPEPNLVLLENALKQSGWRGPWPSETNWKHLVLDALERLDWPVAARDVEPFLERPGELSLLRYVTFSELLKDL